MSVLSVRVMSWQRERDWKSKPSLHPHPTLLNFVFASSPFGFNSSPKFRLVEWILPSAEGGGSIRREGSIFYLSISQFSRRWQVQRKGDKMPRRPSSQNCRSPMPLKCLRLHGFFFWQLQQWRCLRLSSSTRHLYSTCLWAIPWCKFLAL